MGCGGHVVIGRIRIHHVGQLNGYEEDWMTKTKKTIEQELQFRGISPEIINEITTKIEEPSCVVPIVITILVTALICTLIFAVIWAIMP